MCRNSHVSQERDAADGRGGCYCRGACGAGRSKSTERGYGGYCKAVRDEVWRMARCRLCVAVAAANSRPLCPLATRSRAAHFANFDEGGDAGDDNVHVGSNEVGFWRPASMTASRSWPDDCSTPLLPAMRHTQARTLGPWSSAVELVNARQEAAEQRNRALLAEARQGGDGSSECRRPPAPRCAPLPALV